jgi:hypothetical protein
MLVFLLKRMGSEGREIVVKSTWDAVRILHNEIAESTKNGGNRWWGRGVVKIINKF